MLMSADKKITKAKLLSRYAFNCVANEYGSQGTSNSLADLYQLAGLEFKNEKELTRQEHLDRVMPHIPETMHEKINAVEKLRKDIKNFSTDCDEEFFDKTNIHIDKVLQLFDKDNSEEIKLRVALYNLKYSIEEQTNPSGKQQMFEILQKMVAAVKQNDGTFDHDPLNISKKRMEYFMRSIPVEDRIKLLDSIIRKTKDKDSYDYSAYKTALKKEKTTKDAENKAEKIKEKQLRYDDIMRVDLPKATTNQEKIKLCKEALNLVNYKDWGRAKKFTAKIEIYNTLLPIYSAEGMKKEFDDAVYIRNSYVNAWENTVEYAKLKNYPKTRH